LFLPVIEKTFGKNKNKVGTSRAMEEKFLEGRGSVEVFCRFMVKERKTATFYPVYLLEKAVRTSRPEVWTPTK